MWKYVFPPLLSVVILWVFVSTATTLYITWVEETHRRVVQENHASIFEADAIQDVARQIEAIFAQEGLIEKTRIIPLWKPVEDKLRMHMTTISKIVADSNETEELDIASNLVREICAIGTGLLSPDIAKALSAEKREEPQVDSTMVAGEAIEERTTRIRQLTAQLMEVMKTIKNNNRQSAIESDETRDFVGGWFGFARTILLVVGPMFGLIFGLRLSRRLSQSVGRIDVVLNQGDTKSIGVPKVTLRQTKDLSMMEEQAKWIVDRLKQAYGDLARSQAEMIRAERLSSVGRLASGVAHEIRNPLTSVKLLLQNAAKKKSTDSLSGENLQLILEEIGRIEAAVQGLLDYSRARPQNRTCANIRETIEQALALVAGRANQQRVVIKFDEPSPPTIVEADHQQLHQVFVNICINAIEAMPNGGTLSILIRPLPMERIRIEFRDTGSGMSDATLSQLFEPFNTTKEKGTGLGLAVSRAIIDQHDGQIQASNESPHGAKFSIDLSSRLPKTST